MLDNRIIRVDWDVGFEEGRQYGRGYTGYQKRDEYVSKFDPDRPRDSKSVKHKKRERHNNDNNYESENKGRFYKK